MNIKNILTKIIFSDLHLYFFYGFILSIPFQIRKRFLTKYSYFAGGFSEYATFFVYLSDILLILAIFFWVIKIIIRKDSDLSHLSHRYRLPHLSYIRHAINRVTTIFKSIPKIFSSRKKFPLYQRGLGGFLKKILRFLTANKSLSLLLIFCLWLIVDLLLISGDYFFISAYQTLKFLELVALFIYIYFNLTSFKKILTTVSLLALSGLIQSFLAISQYFLQHSVFGSKWIGEIVLSPELPGVAKIMVNGNKIMRAYGTFPHSNILAGFLLITIFLSWYLLTNYPQFINKSVKNRHFSLFNILRKTKNLILDNKFSNLSRSRNKIKTHPYKNYHLNNVSRETLFNNRNKKQKFSSVKFPFYQKELKEFSESNKKRNVSRETLLSICFTFLIFIQILALILTFSRSGWLGFFVILLILGAGDFYQLLFSRRVPFFQKKGLEENFSTNLGAGDFYQLFSSREGLEKGFFANLTHPQPPPPEKMGRGKRGITRKLVDPILAIFYFLKIRSNVSRETLFHNYSPSYKTLIYKIRFVISKQSDSGARNRFNNVNAYNNIEGIPRLKARDDKKLLFRNSRYKKKNKEKFKNFTNLTHFQPSQIKFKIKSLKNEFLKKLADIKNVSRETFLERDNNKTRRNNKNNVSRETFSGYFKILYSNKNILNILFLAILTLFSIIFLWPEISSRNLFKESLIGTDLKSIPTIGNTVRYEKELPNYHNNVSRETLFKSDHDDHRDKFETHSYNHINNVSRETFSDLENKENQNRDLAITDRLFYNKVALNSISKYPFTGTGLGTFVFQIDNYLKLQNVIASRAIAEHGNPVIKLFTHNYGIASLFHSTAFHFIPRNDSEIWNFVIQSNYMKSQAVIARKFAIDDYSDPKTIVHNSMIYSAGLPHSVSSRLLSRSHSVRNGGKILSSLTQNVSRETLLESVGTGLKPVPTKSNAKLEFWRYQPAHNIYLLIASEIGIVGFLIFALFVAQVIKGSNKQIFFSRKGLAVSYFTNSTHPQPSSKKGFQDNVSRETFSILQAQKNLQHFLIAIFIGFLAIGMFDHYFWTLQQGQLEFWLILALIAANERNLRNLNYSEVD